MLGQQEKPALHTVYQDSISALQTWRNQKNAQEFLLSGIKSGLSVGLTLSGDAPSEARINLTAGRSLSAQPVGDRIVISFFETTESEISVTYDLDSDGKWDARISRSKECKIFYDGSWRTASQLEGLLQGSPQAKVSGVQYEFTLGGWKPSAK